MNLNVLIISCSSLFLIASIVSLAQDVDKEFNVTVSSPAYTNNGQKIMVDEAHYNLSNDDSYEPLFKLLRADGYTLSFTSSEISSSALQGVNTMIIINPRGGRYMDKEKVIFQSQECTHLINWIKNGGSLLLIIDNYYSSSASKNVTDLLGVKVGGGVVTDSKNYDKASMRRENLLFSKENNLLAEHIILKGKDKNESVSTVSSFSGTSLKSINNEYSNLLKFSEYAKESKPDSTWTTGKGLFKQTYVRFVDPVSVAGLSQALAFELGKGRVVFLGDGNMLTALVVEGQKQGMNAGNNHNKQFALNIMHWLSRKL
ncbi:MAG: hypothetical protein JNN04_14060 [Cyclobacteriaceae bacterium]|nr:hypothetical protein [Cyclobacteriaceae bacterium]